MNIFGQNLGLCLKKQSRPLLIFAILALGIIIRPTLAKTGVSLYRPSAFPFPYKGYEIFFNGDYFATDAFFDSEGNLVELNEGSSFSMMEGEAGLLYGMGKKLGLRGGLRFRQNDSVTGVNGSETVTNNSGLESYFAHIHYAIKSSNKMYYSLDFKLRQTSYNNTEFSNAAAIPSDEIILGDSGREIEGGIALGYERTKTHFLVGEISFRQPPSELSAEVPYLIESAWAWDSFGVKLYLDGIYSLSEDEVGNRPFLATGNTTLYNSVNRQHAGVGAGVFMASRKWRLEIESDYRYQGANTDRGLHVGVNLTYSPGGISRDEIKTKSFKEYRIEGSIIKVSPRGKFIQIDQGLAQDVEKGMAFDIYESDYFGKNELIARGVVYEVSSSKAIIKILKKYKRRKVEKGFTARAK
jgi:hypothetical protein